MDLLKALIVASEKAANIARLLRQNDILLKKLVEAKTIEDANPKFQEDFKTLADVLIQEMVKYDIGLQFPFLEDKIRGEESNHFFNQAINEEVVIEVKSTKNETAKLLTSILDNDAETANLLATEVHRVVRIEDVNTKVPDREFDIDIDQISIWIDPIDGTNEYINGTNVEKVGDFYLKGLNCVTVLIGVYDNKGRPVMGVVNQPFFDIEFNNGYQCQWGVCCKDNGKETNMVSFCPKEWQETNTICVGSSENITILEILKSAGYSLVISRGAGYKLLTVVLGLADAYILSSPTTYFWDTCAPQAILRALGGDIVEMEGITHKQKNPVKYEIRSDDTKDNKKGIVAYRNEKVLERLLELPWETKNI